ncbi:uncharacterized protein LOC128549650 [Mercenaria mercenaria]|uniref:uncharacterized protein LOC128549650 n=1 Tax=Mercenaria mercenaria TaxID=6596 RepID=UPI00234F6E7E|nr:uncharacterized protein LOC128549650 [Mercenaria mercenaria]
MSEKGWSNSELFRYYLEHHFLPFARPTSTSTQPILLIYHGHSSHKNPETIKWAREHGIILFVLPDVTIFGPFKRYYYSECAQYMYTHMGQNITRYEICALACRPYLKALTPMNIQAGFRKTGIYPLKTDVISREQLLPCENFREKDPVGKAKAIKVGPDAVKILLDKKEEHIRKMAEAEKENEVHQCSCKSKKRCLLQKPDASGKAITEDNYFEDMTNYVDQRKKSPKLSEKKAALKLKTKETKSNQLSPKPSTSGPQMNKDGPGIPVDTDSSSEEEDEDKCCVCGKLSPPRLDDCIKIIGLGKCDACDYWVHLAFCTEERVLRRHSVFLCPHCRQN